MYIVRKLHAVVGLYLFWLAVLFNEFLHCHNRLTAGFRVANVHRCDTATIVDNREKVNIIAVIILKTSPGAYFSNPTVTYVPGLNSHPVKQTLHLRDHGLSRL